MRGVKSWAVVVCLGALTGASQALAVVTSGASNGSSLSASAVGGACPDEVRLDRGAPGIEATAAGLPVRDQDGLQSCYAQVASDFLDIARAALGGQPGQAQQSALYTAIRLAARQRRAGVIASGGRFAVDYGDVCSAMDAVAGSGGCDANVLEGAASVAGMTHAQFLAYVEELLRAARAGARAERAATELAYFLITGRPGCGVNYAPDAGIAALAGHVRELARTAPGWTSYELLLGVIEPLCNSARMEPRPDSVRCESASDREPCSLYGGFCPTRYLKGRMQSHFCRSGRIFPVGISYCMEILTDPAAAAGTAPPRIPTDAAGNPRGTAGSKCSLHASMVIGRRCAPNGKCELLVRNSWGPSCDHYRKWNARTQRFEPIWPCEGGNVWVDEDVLLANTATMETIL